MITTAATLVMVIMVTTTLINTNYQYYNDTNNRNSNKTYMSTTTKQRSCDKYATAQINVSLFTLIDCNFSNNRIKLGSAVKLLCKQQQEASVSTDERVNYSSIIEQDSVLVNHTQQRRHSHDYQRCEKKKQVVLSKVTNKEIEGTTEGSTNRSEETKCTNHSIFR